MAVDDSLDSCHSSVDGECETGGDDCGWEQLGGISRSEVPITESCRTSHGKVARRHSARPPKVLDLRALHSAVAGCLLGSCCMVEWHLEASSCWHAPRKSVGEACT